jgi:hypothetical protein
VEFGSPEIFIGSVSTTLKAVARALKPGGWLVIYNASLHHCTYPGQPALHRIAPHCTTLQCNHATMQRRSFHFRRAEHLELIEFFREALGEDIQESWVRFAYFWLANGEPGTFRLTR